MASKTSESMADDGDYRLWIGDLDPKITEFHLIKLLEKIGKVKKLDFMFHKSGPLEGQPRGYCFVNYGSKEEAERAIHHLNGKLALSKRLSVSWAHAQTFNKDNKTVPLSLEPSSSGSDGGSSSSSKLRTAVNIRAIETKLQMMEENPDEIYSGPSAYNYNKPPERRRCKPYCRYQHNKRDRPLRKFRK